jgi:hypothetical protein
MGDRRATYRVLVGRTERDHLEDLGVDGSVILKSIFKKWAGEARTGCDNEPLGSIKGGEFQD